MPKTVLITGANRGIGLALVKAYLGNGDHVIATCRAPDKADALQEIARKKANLSILPLDVTSQDSLDVLTSTLKGQSIDILINNAGILSALHPELTGADDIPEQIFGHIDPEAWMRVLQTNTIAPVMVTQALLPLLRQSKGRKIVMISSRDGSITHMDKDIPIAYGTSKAALNAATKILASTLQNERFVVVTLNPGWVVTDMGGAQASLSPEESASRLVRVIASLTPQQTGQFLRHTGENIAW